MGLVAVVVGALVFAGCSLWSGVLLMAVRRESFGPGWFGLRNRETVKSAAAWLQGHRAAAPFIGVAAGLSLVNCVACIFFVSPAGGVATVLAVVGGVLVIAGLLLYANFVAARAARSVYGSHEI